MTVCDIEGNSLKLDVFSPADCLGPDLLNYLEDLGFMSEMISVYLGDEELDPDITGDDGHPDHAEALEELMEGSCLCIRMYRERDEIIFNWGTAEIVSHSPLPEKMLKDVNEFIDNYNQIKYFQNAHFESEFQVSNPEDETEIPSLEPVIPNLEQMVLDNDGKFNEKIRKYFSENQMTIQDILREINSSLHEENPGKSDEE